VSALFESLVTVYAQAICARVSHLRTRNGGHECPGGHPMMRNAVLAVRPVCPPVIGVAMSR